MIYNVHNPRHLTFTANRGSGFNKAGLHSNKLPSDFINCHLWKRWNTLDSLLTFSYLPWPSSKKSVMVAEVHFDHGLEASMLVRTDDIRRLSSRVPKFSSQNLESSWDSPRRCPANGENIWMECITRNGINAVVRSSSADFSIQTVERLVRRFILYTGTCKHFFCLFYVCWEFIHQNIYLLFLSLHLFFCLKQRWRHDWSYSC